MKTLGMQQNEVNQTIDYTYDPLDRLTNSAYDNGKFYTYTYDAVGNRLTETTEKTTNTYAYNNANELTNVNGTAYSWDSNGNLLSDGTRTYAYDAANHLTVVSGSGYSYHYIYNGLGDRLQSTLNGVTTDYTLDLNRSLTQVLSDGTNIYTYGLNRIAQMNDSSTGYFLTDALGSVRQVASDTTIPTDEAGSVIDPEIILSWSYSPYGETISSNGDFATDYGYTGEMTDDTGLVNLRARWYDPYLNQFIQPDTIVPDPNQPADWNRYTYVGDNPVNYTDPTGKTRIKPNENSDLNDCVSSSQLQGVDISVKNDVCKMIPELEAAGFYTNMPAENHITVGYRDPKTAHRVSTAFHIIHDFIADSDLEKTSVDLDGTIWYKDEWKYLFPDCDKVNIVSNWLKDLRIKQNASAQISPDYYNSKYYVWDGIFRIKSSAYALEGYASGDPRRLPNSNNPPISKHVLGLAVDIGNGFSNPNLQWSSEIDSIAMKYDLIRPYHQLKIDYANVVVDEWWHFERP